MEKIYRLDEFDNIDNLPDDAVVKLDDRPKKYDPIKEKIVSPGEPGYDELPYIEELLKVQK